MKIKLFFVVLIVLCFGVVFKGSALAQYNQYPMRTNPDVPQNFHTYTQNVVLELLAAVSCSLTGIDPLSQNGKCLGIDPKTKKVGFIESSGGAIGMMGNLIAQTYYIPINTSNYVKSLANNFGVAKKTYALPTDSDPTGSSSTQQSGIMAGYGFQGLKPIMNLWQMFRNIVYLFFVFIFIIIGLGIMFRIKIDPRTVMTIQNQIPKIIIALILVTFSYAIAGFLIDMMYVVLFLIFNLFKPYINAEGLNPATLQGSNPLSAVGFLNGLGMVWDASSGIGAIIASLFDGKIGMIIGGIVGGVIGGSVAALNPIAGAFTALGGAVIGVAYGNKMLEIAGGIIAFVVLAAAVLTALFRLWFALIKAYIFILINTVIAPFWIAGGLIPGSTKNFGMWIRDMIGNLSAFPATLFMLLIGKVFIDEFGNRPSLDQFVPPFIGNARDADSFGALIGIGIVLLTPQVVTMVRAAIKAPEGKYSTAIGGAIKAGAGMNQALLAPAGRNLFGRKNPYTGKREGGVARYGVKRLGQKFFENLPGTQTGPLSVIKKPFNKWQKLTEKAQMSDLVRNAKLQRSVDKTIEQESTNKASSEPEAHTTPPPAAPHAEPAASPVKEPPASGENNDEDKTPPAEGAPTA